MAVEGSVVAVEGSVVAEGSSGDSLTSGKYPLKNLQSILLHAMDYLVAHVLKILVHPCSHFPCSIKNCILV